MKNYEKFFKIALIDILGKMNANLRTNTNPQCGTSCIMYALCDDYFGYFGEYSRIKRCEKHNRDCGKCIAAWLQEDAR